jgi:hypothetical protein
VPGAPRRGCGPGSAATGVVRLQRPSACIGRGLMAGANALTMPSCATRRRATHYPALCSVGPRSQLLPWPRTSGQRIVRRAKRGTRHACRLRKRGLSPIHCATRRRVTHCPAPRSVGPESQLLPWWRTSGRRVMRRAKRVMRHACRLRKRGLSPIRVESCVGRNAGRGMPAAFENVVCPRFLFETRDAACLSPAQTWSVPDWDCSFTGQQGRPKAPLSLRH